MSTRDLDTWAAAELTRLDARHSPPWRDAAQSERTGTVGDISDITWDMMGDAGIDIGHVNRQPTQTGEDEYILIEGDTKVAFGPATDPVTLATNGWDISTYELVEDDGSNGEDWWRHIHQEWAETPAEALRIVAGAVKS